MDQGIVLPGLARMQGLLQRIEHEVGVHRTTDPPADDAPGEHVDHEGHVQPALPGRDVGEVRDPELVGSIGLELAVDPIPGSRLRGRDGRAYGLATAGAAQPLAAHQPLHGAAGHRHAFALQLAPDLVGAVDLQVGVPDALDVRHQRGHRAGRALSGARLRRRARDAGSPTGRSAGPCRSARPIRRALLIDERPHDLQRRSSSAWAKTRWPASRISGGLAILAHLAFQLPDALRLGS